MQAEMKAALAAYLRAIPDSADKAEGIRLGEAIAAKILEARAHDGSEAPDIIGRGRRAVSMCRRLPRWRRNGRA